MTLIGKTAFVTGGSRGIGAAIARKLAEDGADVAISYASNEDAAAGTVAAIEKTGRKALAIRADNSKANELQDAINKAASTFGKIDILVNNAGGAIGLDPVESADPDDWRSMYETNVIGTLQVTRALLPALEASGAGTVLNIGSTAGRIAYEGGGGYTAAKHGVAVMTETLRLELLGRPVRVCEVAPGMVRTEEFALTRFDGDTERADAVYRGVDEPLTADDVADVVAWVATRPQHVNVDLVVVKPIAQASQHKVHRTS